MTKRASAYVVAALLALPLVAGCGSSGSGYSSTAASGGSQQQMSGATTVKTASNSLGTVLVDGSGKTIYRFQQDSGPSSTCHGACVQHWPPVTTTGKPQAGGSVMAAELGTSQRRDGTTQVTYAGHPLYYFAGDSSAGDANGQGVEAFGAKWYVLGSNGSAITGQSSGGSSSGGGY